MGVGLSYERGTPVERTCSHHLPLEMAHILVRFRSVKFESARHDSRSSLNVVCSYINAVILVYIPTPRGYTRIYIYVVR